MTSPNYKKFYIVLGVFEDDDWETVRAAYKRQIRRWHPDRYQDVDQRKIAENKSKDINLAYQTLYDYFQEFGSLPRDDTSPQGVQSFTTDPWPVNEQQFNPEHNQVEDPDHVQTPISNSQQPRHKGYSKILVTGILVAIGYSILEPLFTDVKSQHESAQHGFSDPDSGVENYTFGQTESSIASMSNTTDGMTNAHADSQLDNHSNGQTSGHSGSSGLQGYISIGSSMQDVLAIQGHPLRKTETAWDYGLSRINFQNGKVASWYENPMNPLLVKR